MEKSVLGKKLFAFFSLGLFSALIFGYLWWGRFQYYHVQYIVVVFAGGLFLVAANHLYHRDTFGKLGFRLDNFRRAARWYGGTTLVLGAGIAVLGWLSGGLRLDRWSDLVTYFAWAAVQQYLLQNFLRLRSEDLVGSVKTASSAIGGSLMPVLLAATLFALYHLPNYPLVCMTFMGGLLWCFLYALIPNFFWAWLSQAFLVTIILLFFKYNVANQFQVGLPGYRYPFYGSGVKVAAGYDADKNPVIATLPGADKGTKAHVKISLLEGCFWQNGMLLRNWSSRARSRWGSLDSTPEMKWPLQQDPVPTTLLWFASLTSAAIFSGSLKWMAWIGDSGPGPQYTAGSYMSLPGLDRGDPSKFLNSARRGNFSVNGNLTI